MTKDFIRSISVIAASIVLAWVACAVIIFQYAA